MVLVDSVDPNSKVVNNKGWMQNFKCNPLYSIWIPLSNEVDQDLTALNDLVDSTSRGFNSRGWTWNSYEIQFTESLKFALC